MRDLFQYINKIAPNSEALCYLYTGFFQSAPEGNYSPKQSYYLCLFAQQIPNGRGKLLIALVHESPQSSKMAFEEIQIKQALVCFKLQFLNLTPSFKVSRETVQWKGTSFVCARPWI